MCICLHVYIYIYVYIYTYTHLNLLKDPPPKNDMDYTSSTFPIGNKQIIFSKSKHIHASICPHTFI